jgi:gas vesicle protein
MEIKMWEKIKKFFGFLDTNRDGKVNAEDVIFAQAVAEAKAKKLNDVVVKKVEKVKEEVVAVKEEIVERVEAVKEEVVDIKVAATEVVNQVGDIAKAATGKKRPDRKKKK